ncbi:MAG: 50S ribosomal protein L25 [Flavobacteriales bacterium]|nr:50S ribosomal protein L25 [Flavobacteriales bacterium]
MKTIALKGEMRSDLGKRANKEIRRRGLVPCVLYGSGENLNFSVYEADFKPLVYTPDTYLVRLDVEGKQVMAKLQDIQYHPVSEAIIHADFLAIQLDKPLQIHVPVRITGNSPGVRAGGKLNVKMRKLNVLGLIKDLPSFVEVSIDNLELGKNIRVKDIDLGGLTALDTPENSVVSVDVTRASRSAAAAKEASK